MRSNKEQRHHHIQYALIGIGVISFLILFLLLSRTIIVRAGFIRFVGVLALLAVFEFINLSLHPYLVKLTGDSPLWMLLILIAIAALLVPLHHKVEKWILEIMVQKNKRIRLDAAKKTIERVKDDDKQGYEKKP